MQQVLLTICATAFLLWQYHNPEVVLQIEAPRHVSGIPQYVLDYGQLISISNHGYRADIL